MARNPVTLLLVAMTSIACPPAQKATEKTSVEQGRAEFTEGVFSRSAVCKQCHVDIHQYWSVSAHATSFRNRNFQVAHQQYLQRAGSDAGSPCMACHAPLSLHAETQAKHREWQPVSTLADEGVSCDFCHSVTGVDLAKPDNPYATAPGPIKIGPVKDASDDQHGVAHADLFQQSLFCAGCHEYRRPADQLHIISTYSEWQESDMAAKGTPCQSCHMRVGPGKIVDPKVKRSDRPVNAHQMPGSHSRGLLIEALRLRIDKLEQKGDVVEVEVSVENKGGGHHIPTGMPTRKIELQVEAAVPGGRQFKEQRVYQKSLVDAKGLSVVSDSAAFLDAVKIASDNRIKAGEKRVETFTFPISHSEQVTVRAQLTYSYSPQPESLPEERIGITSVEKSLAAR